MPLFVTVLILQMIVIHGIEGATRASLQNLIQDDIFIEDSTLTDSLVQFGDGRSAWGLMNRGNVLDLVVTGYSPSRGVNLVSIYFFNQDGGVESVRDLPAGSISNPVEGKISNVALGDYDNDGDLDILVTGGGESFLYRNSLGEFERDTQQDLPALLYSTAKWGDFDNDGDLDLFLMGTDTSITRMITGIYINDSLGTLALDETQILASIANGDAAWGDYDKDGDLDLIVAGQSAATGSNLMKLYKNEPTGRLIEDTNQELVGLKAASVTWEDYDSDGDLDLITTGWEGDTTGISITKIYRNEPVGTLSLETNQIPFGVSYGSLDFGDFDNDGDPDMVIAGADSISADAETLFVSTARIYENKGSGIFELQQTLPGGMNATWGDYDDDGALDLFVNGYNNSNPNDPGSAYVRIFENMGTVTNTPPTPPSSLSSFAVGNQVILTWTEGSDDKTEPAALTYNLQMLTRINGDTIRILSEAVPLGSGNVGQVLTKTFHDIPPGTYYWRVQTIDQGLTASGWSEMDRLFIPRLVESLQSLSGMWYNAAAWTDYNNDGNLDLALTGISFDLGGTTTRMFKNDPLGMLTQDLEQDILAIWGGTMAWADYTNDGYLDFVLSGMVGLTPTTYLYRWNSSTGTFELDAFQNLAQVWGGSQIADWADYDNDGDLDLVLGGCGDKDCAEPILKVFQNDSSTILVHDTLQQFTPLLGGVIAWEDFNSDGYMDLFAAGFDSPENSHLKIYLNDSSGVLNEIFSLEGEGVASFGSADWGDYNNDGYPDLAITGLYATGEIKLTIFRNVGGISLTKVDSTDGIFYGYLNWGDYDNDGDLDLVISGNSTIFEDVGTNPITQVYRNDGEGSFVEEDSLNLRWAGVSTVLWGDYDSDGDLDLLVAGTDTSGGDFSWVYDNLESTRNKNLPPATPEGLGEVIDTSRVILTWEAPQDQGSEVSLTPSRALTYNLQVGSTYGGHEIISGNVSYGFGSHGLVNQAFLWNLKDGRYYWRVQAVDNGFARSEWSPIQSFYFDITPPEVDSVVANYGSGNQINLVIAFREANGMDNSVSPKVTVFHPEGIMLDTLRAEQQSYSGNVWTGVVTLPVNFPGQVIEILIQRAKDLGGYVMAPVIIYRAPSKVISSQGGTIISDDGKVTLQLAPNAVDEDVVIKILREELFPINITSADIIGLVYKIIPASLVLNKQSILSILYDTSDLPYDSLGFDPDSLFIGHIFDTDSISWIGGTVDTTSGSRRVTTSIDTLGHYAVFENRGLLVGKFSRLGKLTCQPRIFSPRGGTFSTQTNVLFDLKEQAKVTVRIFNPAGRLKRTVVNGEIMNTGSNAVAWDGRDDHGRVVVSGLYIVTVEATNKTAATTVGVLNK
ncbi:MAG: VCBS repeat-containing protein [Candidatus Marinimicrobia bacterium]|nr:VCBS repeat-containing protein [Candidatus Neomarinimicrobiota bacterium]MBL7046206.1 VCBS repeat-containing protein [Candidatus Neomarinimicrobiota bacterium]